MSNLFVLFRTMCDSHKGPYDIRSRKISTAYDVWFLIYKPSNLMLHKLFVGGVYSQAFDTGVILGILLTPVFVIKQSPIMIIVKCDNRMPINRKSELQCDIHYIPRSAYMIYFFTQTWYCTWIQYNFWLTLICLIELSHSSLKLRILSMAV